MLVAVKGYYENGKITLKEEPPVKTKTDVVVTFLTDQLSDKRQRVPGSLKGKVTIPDDFNEPLEDLTDYME